MDSRPHLGIIASPVPGHLYPLCALARQLRVLGHPVTLFTLPDAIALATAEGVASLPFGEHAFPLGSWPMRWRRISRARGWRAELETLMLHGRIARAAGREIPALARARQIDAFVVDQNQFYGAGIAASLGRPFVTVACTVPLNREASGRLPPPTSGRFPTDSRGGRWRNRAGFALLDLASACITLAAGQGARLRMESTFSKGLQLLPLAREFDWPREDPSLVHVGHLLDGDRPSAPALPIFPEDRPLVLASLGTIHNGRDDLFSLLAEALVGMPVAAVVSEGRWQSESTGVWVSNVLRLPYAPQLALLARASVMVTHGGMNSVTEALYNGVPLVVIPHANDQAGAGARVRASGCGLVLAPNAGVGALREAISQILAEPAFRQRAQQLGAQVRAGGGPAKAAAAIQSYLDRCGERGSS